MSTTKNRFVLSRARVASSIWHGINVAVSFGANDRTPHIDPDTGLLEDFYNMANDADKTIASLHGYRPEVRRVHRAARRARSRAMRRTNHERSAW